MVAAAVAVEDMEVVDAAMAVVAAATAVAAAVDMSAVVAAVSNKFSVLGVFSVSDLDGSVFFAPTRASKPGSVCFFAVLKSFNKLLMST